MIHTENASPNGCDPPAVDVEDTTTNGTPEKPELGIVTCTPSPVPAPVFDTPVSITHKCRWGKVLGKVPIESTVGPPSNTVATDPTANSRDVSEVNINRPSVPEDDTRLCVP